jgi:hypothetical protein
MPSPVDPETDENQKPNRPTTSPIHRFGTPGTETSTTKADETFAFFSTNRFLPFFGKHFETFFD